jgi:HK97 family phage portal protein
MANNLKTIVTIPGWAEFLESDQAREITMPAQAYAYVPLVARATQLRCNALARVPVAIYAGENEIEWPFVTSAYELLWKTEASLLLHGAAYIEIIRTKLRGKPVDLRWINPTTMQTNYVNGQIVHTQNGKLIPNEDLIYIREFSLRDDIRPGDSAAKIALMDAGLLRYMSRFASAFFQNGAMPVTVAFIEGLANDDEAQRVQGRLRQVMAGIRNAMKLIVLNRKIEPKVISQPLKDLAMPDLYAQAVNNVAWAFQLNKAVLEDTANRATAQEYRLGLYQDVVEPRARMLEGELNRQLFSTMNLRLEFKFEQMDIYQEDESQRAASLAAIVNAINTNPDVAQFAMDILGYDLSDEQRAMLDAIIQRKNDNREQMQQLQQRAQEQPQLQEQQPAQQKTYAQIDLERWQKKCLNRLADGKSADCAFTSNAIDDWTRLQIAKHLPECKTADDVRELFAPYLQMNRGVGESEIKMLADAINKLAEKHDAQD